MSRVPYARVANADWSIAKNTDGTPIPDATLAVLMDIRGELRRLNGVLHCPHFQAIPRKLDRIKERLPARKRRKP